MICPLNPVQLLKKPFLTARNGCKPIAMGVTSYENYSNLFSDQSNK